MGFPELYICRHGETMWNVEERMQGWLNSPLTALGEQQAAWQGKILGDCDLAGFGFFSSPLGRAFQTAAIAAGGFAESIHTDSRLREIGVGEWAGMLRRDLPVAEGLDPYIAQYDMAPGGEGFAGLNRRIADFLADLDCPAVLFTHGIASRAIRAMIVGEAEMTVGTAQGGQGVVWHVKNGAQRLLR